MVRSHPPTLLVLAERVLREDCHIQKGERLVLAVSGGGDSTALLHVCARLAPKLGITLAAHGVDHGLRPEAAAELDLAETLASSLGVPFSRTGVRVPAGGNLQARARAARWEALRSAQAATHATRIATAHHADDRAETVLIRLLNGARLGALGVLPASDGSVIRPFVSARKSDIAAHLERHRLDFADDPSNRNRRFLRTRVRFDLLPLLAELSPAIVEHLAALADEAGRPPLPKVTDETGNSVTLGLLHARALERALRLGRPSEIRIGGNRTLRVDPKKGNLGVYRDTEPERARRAALKGGAKTTKSG